jgi:hypothetical protein
MTGGKPWVMKVERRRATRQPVKVGIVSAGKAEILEGLEAGDLVVPAAVVTTEGARIRARPVPAPGP